MKNSTKARLNVFNAMLCVDVDEVHVEMHLYVYFVGKWN